MLRAILSLLIFISAAHAAADDALWARLREGGHVVLIRHARAPGTGDPAGFRVDDCATQRNLSPEGLAQAAAIGAAFRERKVAVGQVLSSRWCRALDTARAAFGKVEPEPALDSFFRESRRGAGQTDRVRALIKAASKERGNLVLVTHQVNITALTRLFPAEGEVIVLAARDGAISVVGRMTP